MYEDLLGCKYKEHGRTKEEGFDCYGLLIEIMRRNGIDFPDMFYLTKQEHGKVSDELFNKIHYKQYEKPQKMCIIVFNIRDRPTHVGVYLGDGYFIHSIEKVGVVVEPLSRWANRVKGYYNVSDS